ncbi:MAG: hypothetical protein AAFQ77_03220 [Myxococcota bacterium]
MALAPEEFVALETEVALLKEALQRIVEAGRCAEEVAAKRCLSRSGEDYWKIRNSYVEAACVSVASDALRLTSRWP